LWPDTYGIFHLEGYAVTANDREFIRGRYLFRTNANLSDSQASEIVDPVRVEIWPITSNQIASFLPQYIMVNVSGNIAGIDGSPRGVPIYGLDDDGEPNGHANGTSAAKTILIYRTSIQLPMKVVKYSSDWRNN